MTDERLSELEAVCGAEADEDGKVKFCPGDVLELIYELRELRKLQAIAHDERSGLAGESAS